MNLIYYTGHSKTILRNQNCYYASTSSSEQERDIFLNSSSSHTILVTIMTGNGEHHAFVVRIWVAILSSSCGILKTKDTSCQ